MEFLQAFDDYVLNRNSFSDAAMCTAEFKKMAEDEVRYSTLGVTMVVQD